MPVAITVLYPQTSDATFDLDYYLSSHMPFVQEKFGPHGMTGYRVAKLVGTATGDESPHSVCCTLEFGSVEEFQNALKAEAGPVLGDVKNFSNKDPVLLVGDVVGSGP
ncbi:hypothetical protein W97_02664 [Coniosporium apollinis CBS 100218]|uniref:EthD domain-containing protein n=1 Tax=Coniosporium apollinis (strain CBS 100218) TaxID=1168221 RepID=R7YNG2_CONA1|nr:uncharacterized protein W97_02664 [Coniosporium apollinis CBS 100218]EON63437.1 hypothetical protein W97_02664 [Coniosporium apollinis CBS 100218]